MLILMCIFFLVYTQTLSPDWGCRRKWL